MFKSKKMNRDDGLISRLKDISGDSVIQGEMLKKRRTSFLQLDNSQQWLNIFTAGFIILVIYSLARNM